MEFEKLLKIMEVLRAEGGCPWDREQTRESLKPYLIEEAYELLEAIEEDAPETIKEELGDLLLQIVFHAQIAKEQGEFDIYDVIKKISEKLIFRHPHVFGNLTLSSTDEVLDRWDVHKRSEGKLKDSILEGIPKNLPSLLRACIIQKRVSRVGFDWEKTDDVIKKLEEEVSEFKTSIKMENNDKIENELGDLLFTIVNVARFINVDPDHALRATINRFIKRFKYIEEDSKEEGRKLSEYTLEEMDMLWEYAKRKEKDNYTHE